MSTLGSVLIKSCRNIFSTVQRKWGCLVKLVSLHGEDLWGGSTARGVCLGRTVSGFSFPSRAARVALCFSSSSVLPGEVFPQPPGRGTAMKALSPADLASCVSTSFPLLNMPRSEYIKFREVG